jgi:hypothetical protein
MAQSAVECCNSALQRLGAARILSLADNTREARSCTVAYDSNRRAELRAHLWNFAVKRVVIAADSTAPAFEYTYAFTLPSDCLRVIIPLDNELDWQIEGRKILTNSLNSPYGGASSTSASLSLKYIADIDDPTLWDSQFFDILSMAMAMDMCEDLTQSNTKYQLITKNYDEAVSIAKRTDALENLPSDAPDSSWITARI